MDAGRRSYGKNCGGQFPDRGLGSGGKGPCRNHLSIAGFKRQPSRMASRHSAPAGDAADPLQQPACDGEDYHPRRAHGATAGDSGRQRACRTRCVSWRSARMAQAACLVQKLFASCRGEAGLSDPALWQGCAVQHGRAGSVLHKLRQRRSGQTGDSQAPTELTVAVVPANGGDRLKHQKHARRVGRNRRIILNDDKAAGARAAGA